jgi:hypothetical protein
MRNFPFQELNVKCFVCGAPLVVLLTCLLPGCGSKDDASANSAGALPTATRSVVENPRFQDARVKAMLQKKGGPQWSPDMAKMAPPGTPTK